MYKQEEHNHKLSAVEKEYQKTIKEKDRTVVQLEKQLVCKQETHINKLSVVEKEHKEVLEMKMGKITELEVEFQTLRNFQLNFRFFLYVI